MNSTEMDSPSRPDIRGRDDIERLVHAFHANVQRDDLLGFIFNEVAKTDWTTHLPKMVSFNPADDA